VLPVLGDRQGLGLGALLASLVAHLVVLAVDSGGRWGGLTRHDRPVESVAVLSADGLPSSPAAKPLEPDRVAGRAARAAAPAAPTPGPPSIQSAPAGESAGSARSSNASINTSTNASDSVAAPATPVLKGDGPGRGRAPATLAQYRMALLIALRDALRVDPVWQAWVSAGEEAPAMSAGSADAVDSRFGLQLFYETGRLVRGLPMDRGSTDRRVAHALQRALELARALAPPAVLADRTFVIEIEFVAERERSGQPAA
jgi:hypothetical protein